MYVLYAVLVGLSWILSSWFLRHREILLIERQNALALKIEVTHNLVLLPCIHLHPPGVFYLFSLFLVYTCCETELCEFFVI